MCDRTISARASDARCLKQEGQHGLREAMCAKAMPGSKASRCVMAIAGASWACHVRPWPVPGSNPMPTYLQRRRQSAHLTDWNPCMVLSITADTCLSTCPSHRPETCHPSGPVVPVVTHIAVLHTPGSPDARNWTTGALWCLPTRERILASAVLGEQIQECKCRIEF
jgi:hypothetical protein